MTDFIIDKVIFSEKKDCVILSLTQPDPWNKPDVINLLKKRLGEYLFAIESGYVEKEFPKLQGKPVAIRIAHYFPLPEVMLHQTMPLIQDALQKKNIGFELLFLDVSYEVKKNRTQFAWARRFLHWWRGKPTGR